MKSRLFILVVLLMVFGNIKVFSFFRTEPVETRSISFLERLIYDRVNEERFKHNLPKLEWSSDITEVARKHSQDMAIKGYFAHENKEGELVGERLEKDGIVFTVSAENLFKCLNYQDVAEESVRGWMQSPGHRKNILNVQVEEAGVGVYKVNGEDEYYITQNFIKRALGFVPLPSKLSEDEIDKIFNMVKDAIKSSDYRNIALKKRLSKEFINANIPVKRDFVVEGFLGNSPALKLKIDLMVGNGFIIDFTDKGLEDEKGSFSQLITSQGYSAVVLIRIVEKRIEYLLIKAE